MQQKTWQGMAICCYLYYHLPLVTAVLWYKSENNFQLSIIVSLMMSSIISLCWLVLQVLDKFWLASLEETWLGKISVTIYYLNRSLCNLHSRSSWKLTDSQNIKYDALDRQVISSSFAGSMLKHIRYFFRITRVPVDAGACL